MSSNPEMTYELDFCPSRYGRRGEEKALSLDGQQLGEPPCPAIARIARLMALALRFEGMVRKGEVRDYASLAVVGKVSRARMSQIMKLLHLAPDIQEQLLFLPLIDGLHEVSLRPVVQRIDWSEQRLLFQEILERKMILSTKEQKSRGPRLPVPTTPVMNVVVPARSRNRGERP